ncbi:MAG: hypothetical protein N3E51_02525 [Candidatus Micrarchaeota archaeon]|nr:hypothetical protein [Candidatus Micrarchaeota archaeon]
MRLKQKKVEPNGKNEMPGKKLASVEKSPAALFSALRKRCLPDRKYWAHGDEGETLNKREQCGVRGRQVGKVMLSLNLYQRLDDADYLKLLIGVVDAAKKEGYKAIYVNRGPEGDGPGHAIYVIKWGAERRGGG